MGSRGDILPPKDTPIIPYFLDQRTPYTTESSKGIGSYLQTLQNLLNREHIKVPSTKSRPALEIAENLGDCSTPL